MAEFVNEFMKQFGLDPQKAMSLIPMLAP